MASSLGPLDTHLRAIGTDLGQPCHQASKPKRNHQALPASFKTVEVERHAAGGGFRGMEAGSLTADRRRKAQGTPLKHMASLRFYLVWEI